MLFIIFGYKFNKNIDEQLEKTKKDFEDTIEILKIESQSSLDSIENIAKEKLNIIDSQLTSVENKSKNIEAKIALINKQAKNIMKSEKKADQRKRKRGASQQKM